ncbi:MAG: prephenate dehydrogenase [Actinomycetota bacterium]|nr:prephenate dehydrogenase [Actinomycetota bacterium]
MNEQHSVDGQRRQAVDGPVLIVGTGLIGTSVALSLRRAGVEVVLDDTNVSALQEAVYRGAGSALADQQPALVVVAVPPDAAAQILAETSQRFTDATITDTTSVKGHILDQAIVLGADPHRLVGGHPMAGREVSGPAAARADLLDDRLWIITPSGHEGEDHVARVRRLVDTCGATVTEMDAAEHDAAVALVSHAPQMLASTLASVLVDEPAERLAIAGQGMADTTRIAASNADLWVQILRANAGPVSGVLQQVIGRLQVAADTLAAGTSAAGTELDLAPVAAILEQGREGQSRLPGKHGTIGMRYAVVPVMVEDKPGELARLFVAAGDLDINLEDVRIEHVLGRPSGLVDLFVRADSQAALIEGLEQAGFDVRA